MITPAAAVAPTGTPVITPAAAPSDPGSSFAPVPPPFAANSLQTGVINNLNSSAASGRADMAKFLAAHPVARDDDTTVFSAGIQLPPDAAGQIGELRFLHQIQATRTPAENVTARFYSDHGRRDIWQRIVDTWATTVPAAEAAQGEALLARAFTLNSHANEIQKNRFALPHPYRVDPSLDPIFSTPDPIDPAKPAKPDKPKKPSYTYPSSHASDAYVGAAIATQLMPARADEFTQLAQQVAYSRLYAGVHYLSDVTAAAWLGSAVASYVLATPAALPATPQPPSIISTSSDD